MKCSSLHLEKLLLFLRERFIRRDQLGRYGGGSSRQKQWLGLGLQQGRWRGVDGLERDLEGRSSGLDQM